MKTMLDDDNPNDASVTRHMLDDRNTLSFQSSGSQTALTALAEDVHLIMSQSECTN